MAVSQEQYDRALSRLKKLRTEGKAALGTAVEVLEVQSGAGTMGFIDGYWGKPNPKSGHIAVEVAGVPVAFGVGVGLHLLGAFGLVPDHMHALGNGFMASEVARMGFEAGQKQAAASPHPAAAGNRIPLAMAAGRSQYSDDLLQRIARGSV